MALYSTVNPCRLPYTQKSIVSKITSPFYNPCIRHSVITLFILFTVSFSAIPITADLPVPPVNKSDSVHSTTPKAATLDNTQTASVFFGGFDLTGIGYEYFFKGGSVAINTGIYIESSVFISSTSLSLSFVTHKGNLPGKLRNRAFRNSLTVRPGIVFIKMDTTSFTQASYFELRDEFTMLFNRLFIKTGIGTGVYDKGTSDSYTIHQFHPSFIIGLGFKI